MRGQRSKRHFSSPQREACYRLKLEGLTGRDAAELLAAGYGHLQPFSIPPQTVNRIARELADYRGDYANGTDLAKARPGEAVDALVRETIRLGQDQLARLQSRSRAGRLTSRELRDF